MNLVVERKIKTDKSTIGELSVDGKFFCYTLEDRERAFGVKVYGETAIPTGTYDVVIDYSERFKRRMPHVLNVKGFEGIRIHPGNLPNQTLGCLLVGMTYGSDSVSQSKVAYEKLFRLLDGEKKISLTII